MFSKNQLIYDPIKEGDTVGSFLKDPNGNLISSTDFSGKRALDVSVVNNTGNLFSRPFDKLLILNKDEYGNPLIIKSQLNSVDVQLVTLIYDEDGDLLSLEISEL